MRVAYSSAAARDVKRALDYYKREGGANVAEDFINRLEAKVLKILKSPKSYRIGVKDFRFANLDRSPYQIVYRIADASVIRVISVRHHKQHPNYGLDR